MCTLVKVSVQNVHQIVDPLLLRMSDGTWVDGLCVGDSVQCPLIWKLCNRVQGSQKAVFLCTVAWVRTG